MRLNHRIGTILILVIVSSGVLVAGAGYSPLNAASSSDRDYNIVKAIDCFGSIRYEIMEVDIISLFEDELDNEYKAATEEWNEVRKQWKKSYGRTVPFKYPKPMRPKIDVLAKGIASRSDAKIELETFKSQGPFCVVQVTKGAEKELPEVILKDEIEMKEYSLSKGYSEKLEQWAEEKVAFEDANPKNKFQEPRPDEPRLKVLKNGVRTQAMANAYLSKYKK